MTTKSTPPECIICAIPAMPLDDTQRLVTAYVCGHLTGSSEHPPEVAMCEEHAPIIVVMHGALAAMGAHLKAKATAQHSGGEP